MKINWKHEINEEGRINTATIAETILKNRNIKDIKEFLNPPSPLSISLTDFNPSYKLQLIKVIRLLKEIKEKKQTIVVYTDYDADGITGGAILWETLHFLGFHAMPYVPHRKLEGYGFSIKGIDNVKKQFNPRLIISVDHGITAKEKIRYAKSLGISVIVTDHHLKPEELPTDAEAIFHIPELSGSGVAYFFSKMIFENFEAGHPKGDYARVSNLQLLTANFEIDYLCLTTIGTIADLVPLTGASRSIVKHGLEAFQHSKRVGLKCILTDARIEGRRVTPYEIGFMIAPRINAVGRLEHAIDALRLLCTTDAERAKKLAANVGEKNRLRQDMVTFAVKEAIEMINSQSVNSLIPKLIILNSSKWHEGIIGLIASKITETYYRPTIVMTQSDGHLKGSARSVPSFHITDFLRGLKKYLVDVGGHKGAAGFTIEKKNLESFMKNTQKKADKLLTEKDLERKIEADIKIPLSKINIKWVKELEKLQPFGMGNPQPTFYSNGTLVDAKLFGKQNEHLKIWLCDVIPAKAGIQPLEFIAFNQAPRFTKLSRGQQIDVVYSLEISRWNREERVRGKIQQLIVVDNHKTIE
jgi:single-stranded-DNA-specific exonuclease